MPNVAAFKYTFPIAKAEKRDDGYYITGYASGPEVDLEDERMTPEAIEKFSAQINNSPEKLAYRDAHAPDGVLRDLGEITKAWVNEHFHLGIEVKLDMQNPAASYLYKQIDERKKQYGMSVAGRVEDYIDEVIDGGKVVRTYKDVVLDEISNTTRPAWYPSFGTVLSKSIKDASSDVSTKGENTLGATATGELLDEHVEGTTKSADETTATEKSSDAASDAASAAYIEASILNLIGGESDEAEDMAPLRVALAAIQQFIAQEAAEIGTEMDTKETGYAAWSQEDKALADEIVKTGRKLSNATAAELRELHETMTATLANLGVIETVEETETTSEKSASSDEGETVEKTETTETTVEAVSKSDLDALATDLKKANERIAELEALPNTTLPGAITDDTRKAEDWLADALSKADPSEKVRLAFALHTQGK